MPSEKLVPYRLELYERRQPENGYNLAQLHNHDTGFPEHNVLDAIEDFLRTNEGTNLEPPTNDKTFVIEEFERHGNVIEGIVSTGYHGYEAEIRDVESGEVTHLKEEDEAEQMPLYFLIYFPYTQAGEWYDDGESVFIILGQVNRIGVKTKLTKHLKQFLLGGVSNTTMNINPVTTEDVLKKVIEADRIAKLDLHVRTIPGDDESRFQLVQGLDTEEVGSRSLVLRPEHGGSFEWLKNQAQRFRDSDTHFGEIVDDDVENLTVTIQKGGGRSESFSLLNEEVAMRKDLDSEDLQTEAGLITADSLRTETNNLVNDILNDDIVEPLTGTTTVERNRHSN